MDISKPVSGLSSLIQNPNIFHPGLSIDCVVFGFHEKTLKVLLTNYKGFDFWMLPGSFVLNDENVNNAAHRILYELTGLENVFLRQFYLFGDANRRIDRKNTRDVFESLYGIKLDDKHWFNRRFVTMGYYALVDYTKVKISPLSENERVEWKDFDSGLPEYADHNTIMHKAMETIRFQLGLIPVGRELLPEKFTMSELRVLYETILGKPLNRRNFERKVLSYDYIDKLNERLKGVAYKSPTLYSFNLEKYKQAEVKGLNTEWL